ncbi:MAG: hypothetical protein JRD93_22195, partial [Deltaproteobacteria bacterium]|nr:hypothetical protein [Deltaproteobacteria bacterium]
LITGIIFTAACSHPVYTKTYTKHLDVNGNVTGYTIVEPISRMEPNTTPLKVQINNADKLER